MASTLLALGLAVTVLYGPQAALARDATPRQQLRAAELHEGFEFAAPIPMGAFTPPRDAPRARHRFEGRLTLLGQAKASGFREHQDDYDVVGEGDAPPRHLPGFDFEFFQVGQALVPLRRGAIPGGHPYWEFILGPGRTWQDPGDGDYSRAALPFSLQEVNANCTHNGVLSFLYKGDGSISRVAYQVSSETCAYFKVDMWGLLEGIFTPHAVANRQVLVRAYRRELAARWPRKPLAALALDYPGVEPGGFGSPEEVRPADMTTWGLIVNGTHYVGGCPTRAGEYPFCEALDLPSYSLAKSMFAALALMRLEKLYPGAAASKVADYVPECQSSGNWSDVTFGNLLDMASGNYRSEDENADEIAAIADERFFIPATHREKIEYACNSFPRQAPPGTRWVYHTSDTYLLGVAMNAFLKRKRGGVADILDDVVIPDIWRAMELSPTVEVSRRTLDADRQAFAGYGLTLEPDDLARLAGFFQAANPLPDTLLDRPMYGAALQRDPADRGLPASADGTLWYQHGFWAFRVMGLPGCAGPQFLPFMSGFGGISVVLLTNGATYYYFSDAYDFHFRRAVFEAAKIRGYCQPSP